MTYVDPALDPGFYEYYVIAVYYFGESGVSDNAYALITGINEIDASMFSIFPNPASDLVLVQSDLRIESYEVLNNTGQVVITVEVNGTNPTINVSQFESGIYYIKLRTSDGIALRKLAIK